MVQCGKSLLGIVHQGCPGTLHKYHWNEWGCAAAVPGEIAPKHFDLELHALLSEKKYAHGTAFSIGMNGKVITTGNYWINLPFTLCGLSIRVGYYVNEHQ